MKTSGQIKEFSFPEGLQLSQKYTVIQKVGAGWEGEVYIVRENLTGIERAAKFFYPKRNKHNKTLKFLAKKLHKLRNCSILIQYLTQDTLEYKGQNIRYLVSEFVEGPTLDDFLQEQRGKRLHPFQALHLVHRLAQGMEEIHRLKDYHGDLHTGNVIVRRVGLHFDLKIIDFFHWGSAKPENLRDDVCDLVRILYDSIGGIDHYAKQPEAIKKICCGLKRNLILKKYKNAGELREYIENLEWF